jgi:septum site-determining protein MinD
MGRVYAVASAKGGVGKTTTTANLGVALAAAGHRVVAVDADLGMPNLGRMLGLSPDGPTLHDVLAGEADPLAAVYEGPRGLAVVPGTATLDAYATADPRTLRPLVSALADEYDVVLVDTGAGLSHDTVLPLGLADAVLLVSTPSPDALGDTDRTRQLADRVGVPVAGLLLTRVDTEAVDVDALVSDFGVDLLDVVPEDPSVEAATSAGDPVVVSDADSPAAAAYRAVADALAAAATDDVVTDADAVAADETPATVPETETTPGPRAVDEIDLSSALDTATDTGTTEDLDAVFDLDEHAADVGDADESPSSSGADATADEADADAADEDDADATADADEADEDDGISVDDADSGGGLAATLADVESGAGSDTDPDSDADDAADETRQGGPTDEPPDDEPVSVADAVAEAEPDADKDVTFDTAPDDAAGADVTIQPDDAPDIPDAESDSDSGPESESATAPDGAATDADADERDVDADPADADADDTESEEKKGLFGRFFG